MSYHHVADSKLSTSNLNNTPNDKNVLLHYNLNYDFVIPENIHKKFESLYGVDGKFNIWKDILDSIYGKIFSDGSKFLTEIKSGLYYLKVSYSKDIICTGDGIDYDDNDGNIRVDLYEARSQNIWRFLFNISDDNNCEDGENFTIDVDLLFEFIRIVIEDLCRCYVDDEDLLDMKKN